ncbi:hypothetical protein [Rhodothermus marinus]|uniref:hypothetical protein n=1 Tax=Rhodothermus marinus TaxID=29549 RepID=UPI0006D1FEFB|nr:hypothetical protein [Rhodothermus marinus]
MILIEGEKAAEALKALGVNAVGTVTGAASQPSDEALKPLAAFERIYLWPDNDGPGRDHMLRIGDRFQRLEAKDVRVLEWCDAPEHGDAADFIEHYGDRAREKLRELVAVAQPSRRGLRTCRRSRRSALKRPPRHHSRRRPGLAPTYPT